MNRIANNIPAGAEYGVSFETRADGEIVVVKVSHPASWSERKATARGRAELNKLIKKAKARSGVKPRATLVSKGWSLEMAYTETRLIYSIG
jgi:hypothetical protein